MKLIFVAAFLIVSSSSFSQSPKNDLENWEPPYKLIVLDGWSSEHFMFPIEFAPTIPFKGVEDLRFAPGWSDEKSNEYWTYAFLWYLDDAPEMNADIISRNLKDYFSGLTEKSVNTRKTAADKITPVKTSFEKIGARDGDYETFSGTISMYDYMSLKPMTLNCIAHLKTCAGQRKTIVFFEISPKPTGDNVWKSLDKLWAEFACEK